MVRFQLSSNTDTYANKNVYKLKISVYEYSLSLFLRPDLGQAIWMHLNVSTYIRGVLSVTKRNGGSIVIPGIHCFRKRYNASNAQRTIKHTSLV